MNKKLLSQILERAKDRMKKYEQPIKKIRMGVNFHKSDSSNKIVPLSRENEPINIRKQGLKVHHRGIIDE